MRRFPIIKLCMILLIACYLIALSSVRGEAANGRAVLQKETAEEHLAKGRDAYSKKQYKTARKELKRAINLKKDLPDAHLLLATIYRSEGKVKAAINHAKEAVKYQWDYPAAHYLLARSLFEMRDLAAAQQELNVALSQNPDHAPSYRLKGDLEIAMAFSRSSDAPPGGRYKTVLEAYEKALRLASPQDEGVPALRLKVEALKNYIAFSDNKDDPAYKPPLPMTRPPPRITDAAFRAGVRGKIWLAAVIDEKGDVADCLVLRGLGYGLDEEAVRTVRMAKFSPGTKYGVPVPYWQPLVIEFNL